VSARYKGLYIIGETGALYPSTGASHHIKVGIEQLCREFDIEKVLFCKAPVIANTSGQGATTRMKRIKHSAGRRFLKWVYLLLSNHAHFIRYYRLVRRIKPVFIYERASYLNYNGIIISWLLNIPHFYEVNGILANDYAKHFPGVCNRWSYKLEKRACHSSTFGFYVGGLNRDFDVPEGKYLAVQNGVDEKFAAQFRERVNEVNGRIEVAFIGSAMDHHRLDLFADAINNVENPSAYRLSFIGSGLEDMDGKLKPSVERKFFGSLSHDEISKVISRFNLAIIPHALEYFSHVKVFMYGAAKLLLILPRTQNFTSVFTSDEVLFVENGNTAEITACLNRILAEPEVFSRLGNNVHNKVYNYYTWENIFREVTFKIKEQIENFNATR